MRARRLGGRLFDLSVKGVSESRSRWPREIGVMADAFLLSYVFCMPLAVGGIGVIFGTAAVSPALVADAGGWRRLVSKLLEFHFALGVLGYFPVMGAVREGIIVSADD